VRVLELIGSDGTIGSSPICLHDQTYRAIKRLGPDLLGRPIFAAAERWATYTASRGPHALGPTWAAVSAIENASADLCARTLGIPLYELLGGCARRRITVAMSIVSEHGDIDSLIARAGQLLALGVQAIAVRCTPAEWRSACALLRAAREVFGRDLRLRLSLLRALPPNEYECCMRAVIPLELEYIQDATVHPRTSDTTQCTRHALRDWDNVADALRSPAFHAMNLSVMGWGGVAGIGRLAAACRVFQREVVLSCDVANGAELPISVHVALALPAVTMGVEIPIKLDDAIFARVCQGIPTTEDGPPEPPHPQE
jgi:L-alanine-DL-glutamate epimerase-like enolase superfamily enzyme